MGLFDVFGAGGGSAAIQIAATMVGAGTSLEGNVVFTGGKRAQQITCVTMRVSQSRQTMQMTKEGPRQHTESRDVIPQFQIAGATQSTPGQAQSFPFSINIPAGAPPSMPGQLSYAIHANVDIPGEVDAGASVPITIVAGAGAQMPMQPQAMGMPQMPPPMGQMPQMPPPMGYPHQAQMPPPMGQMPQMPPAMGYPQQAQMPPPMGYPQQAQMPPPMGYPQQAQMPPPMGYPQQAQMPPPMGYPQQAQMPPPMGMPPMGMAQMPPQMGSHVVAQHPSGQWAPGRITAMQNGMLGVDWDDPKLGASTWVSAAQVRVK